MATPVIYNGVTYFVPSYSDVGYAQGAGNMSAYWIALASGSLQATGGPFTLTNDVNFGPNFGLLSKYFTSVTSTPANAGVIRLAKADTIDWRNNANSGDNVLAVNGSDQLTYNGTPLTQGGITALFGDVTATGPGAVSATLATVNGNVGSFTNASITVDGKGRITAASSGSLATGDLTDVGTDGITITGGTGAVLGSGTSIDQHVADATHNGYLSAADFNTFSGIVTPLPSGVMVDFGGTAAPSGWLLCDGSSNPTATYPTLFAAIGYTWGGSGANFSLPDMTRRVGMGSGGSGTAIIGNAVGDVGGAESVTVIQNPFTTIQNAHQHISPVLNAGGVVVTANLTWPGGTSAVTADEVFASAGSAGSGSRTALNTTSTTATNTATTATNQAGSVIQPSAIVLKIIKI